MYFICYKSILNQTTSQDELTKILDAAKSNNAKKDITGMLLFIQNQFIQYIEGEETAIKSLFEKIRKDPRHYSVQIMSEGNNKTRHFSGWTMGYKALDEDDLEDIAEMNKMPGLSIEKLLNEATPHYAIELLKVFYNKD